MAYGTLWCRKTQTTLILSSAGFGTKKVFRGMADPPRVFPFIRMVQKAINLMSVVTGITLRKPGKTKVNNHGQSPWL